MSDSKLYQYDRNSKKLVAPEPQDVVTVIKGTEAGHFFAVTVQSPDVIIGVRQLSQDCGSLNVKDNTEARIRLLPLNEDAQIVAFAQKLGFTKKTGGHYSIVTNAPATMLSALNAFIEVV